MTHADRLLAWIEPGEDGEFVAALTANAIPERTPATQACSSPDEARQWVRDQSEALGVSVEWVNKAPKR